MYVCRRKHNHVSAAIPVNKLELIIDFALCFIHLTADDHATVKKVMVHNPIYSEPLYDKVGGPPQIAIPPLPPSACDTQSINSSPLVGTPTPLLSTHYAHHGQKFIYDGTYIHSDIFMHV